MRGKYLVFEGMDGCGKDTQLEMFSQILTDKFQIEHIKILEPGETEIGQIIRPILKNPPYAETLDDVERLLGFCWDRALTRRKVITPSLEKGIWVLSARSRVSSDAFQGFAGKIHLDIIKIICDFAMQGVQPDKIFIFDVPVEIALERIGGRQGDMEDFFDSQKRSFHEEVYKGYQWAYENYKPLTVRIDASKSIDEVFAQLMEYMEDEILCLV